MTEGPRDLRSTVLIVDDQPGSADALAGLIEDEFRVLTAASGSHALRCLETERVDVILVHQQLPDMSGVALLVQALEQWPSVVRLMISEQPRPRGLVNEIRQAAIYQYLTGTWHPEALRLAVRNGARLRELQQHNERLAQGLGLAGPQSAPSVSPPGPIRTRQFKHIIRAPDSPLNEAVHQLEQVAPYPVSVLITGESGTGKELFAEALHCSSQRASHPFLSENCGAIANELLESELFGHVKGAYTGAFADRTGLFAEADGGTLFLDEIGEVSPEFQVKLLRVLQNGEFRPVGSNRQRHTNVRVIAATNRDLEAEVRAGRFRADLYYRLAEMTLHLPPLRARPMDIEPLARHLIAALEQQLNKAGPWRLQPDSLHCFKRYRWPGNVRELSNVIKQMLVLSPDGRLAADLLPARVRQCLREDLESTLSIGEIQADGTLKERIEELEAAILRETLLRHRWNKSRAAEELGLSRVGLRNKLDRYGLERKLDS